MRQAKVLQTTTERVREAQKQTKAALDAWQAEAAKSHAPNDAGLEAYRAEWQRARDEYLRLLESFFLIATGALAEGEDLEARLTASVAALGVPS